MITVDMKVDMKVLQKQVTVASGKRNLANTSLQLCSFALQLRELERVYRTQHEEHAGSSNMMSAMNV